MTYVVYLDVVVVGNLVMNYVILWATAKFAQYNPSRWRLLCGAAVGSLYALAVFIPQLQGLLIWFVKVIISILMVITVFAPLPWRRFLTCLGYFYVASFAIGGIVFAAMYFIQANGYFGQLLTAPAQDQRYFWLGILVALAITWVVVRWGAVAHAKTKMRNSNKTVVYISSLNHRARVEALLDTGNSLTDPLTNLPVMVVEYNAVKDLLPIAVQQLYQNQGTLDFIKLQSALLNQPPGAMKFALIPYRSLGRENGMLLGFKPDLLEIETSEGPVFVKEVMVAIHHGELALDNGYRALLHPQIIKAA